MTTGSDHQQNELSDKHRRIAVWYRRQAENLLRQAEWHEQRSARLDVAAETEEATLAPEVDVEAALPTSDDAGCGRKIFVVAGIAGLFALWQRLRGQESSGARW